MCVWVYWSENKLAKCACPKLQTFAYHFLWSLSLWPVTVFSSKSHLEHVLFKVHTGML